jgi:phosphoserine phosphatase RsbU/P
LQSRVLQYVNAGRNPPIVIRQEHDRSVLLPLSPEGAPVGALRYSRYKSTTLQLQVHDVLVAYTDGVTDSPDIEGNSFEQKRLERVLLDCRFRDPNKILRVILDELSSLQQAAHKWTTSPSWWSKCRIEGRQ